jgi:hypothetical protein
MSSRSKSFEAAARLADYRGEQDYIETGASPGDDGDDAGALLSGSNGAEGGGGDPIMSDLHDLTLTGFKDSAHKDLKVRVASGDYEMIV